MNPEHKESAEDFLLDNAEEMYHDKDDFTMVISISKAREYAQLAVKEAREQDIKEMEKEIKLPDVSYPAPYINRNIATNKCISIVKSKLEGGE
jgi:hypothetical protein